MTLPVEGRGGDAPPFPLVDPTPRELELWAVEWSRPQAVAWEANGQELEVALYVRSVADAESHRASVAARTLVRQQMDALGLTVPGLRSNRWIIGEKAPAAAGRGRARPSSKSRLKVVADESA